MTAHHLHRRLPLTIAVAAFAVVSLLAAGCGGSSSSSPPAGSSHSTESSASSSDAARETAEKRLETISGQLGKVLAAYKSGKKQQAYTLAKSVSTNLYEGTTEGIVSKMDPAGERQIDPMLATTIPAAIQNSESASAVAALIHQAQTLASSCLDAIHKEEGS